MRLSRFLRRAGTLLSVFGFASASLFPAAVGDAQAASSVVSQPFSMTNVGQGPALVLASGGYSTCTITLYGPASGNVTLVPQVSADQGATLTTASTIGGGSITGPGVYTGNIANTAASTTFTFAITSLTGTASGVETCSAAVGTSVVSGTVTAQVSPIPLPVTCSTPCNFNTAPPPATVPPTALPAATAGASPTAAPPSVAQITCLYPVGGTPNITAGNEIAVQCNANGAVQVVGTVNTAPPPNTAPPTALPVATAGASPTAAPPTIAEITCVTPLGGTPNVTAGHSIAVQCNAAGQELVALGAVAPVNPTISPQVAVTSLPVQAALMVWNSGFNKFVYVSGGNGEAEPGYNPIAAAICNNTIAETCIGINPAASPVPQTGVVLPSAVAQNSAAANGPTFLTECDQSVVVNISTATTTQIVAVSGTTSIYVCGYQLQIISGTTPSFYFEYGTSTSCTGTHALMGTMGGIAGAVGEIYTFGTGIGYIMHTPAGANGLCIVSGGTTPNIQGVVTYAQF